MDFGYPQNLSPEILKLYITQEGVRSPFSSKVRVHYVLCMYWNCEYGSIGDLSASMFNILKGG